MKKISAFLFNKILGWRVANEVPRLPKCVITVAPHTSNWDFIVAKLAYSSLGRTAHFLIKSEWFVFPFNLFFKRIGGIPVKRDRSESLTDTLAEEFQKLRIKWNWLLHPKGTRKPVTNGKRASTIALKAGVPLCLLD